MTFLRLLLAVVLLYPAVSLARSSSGSLRTSEFEAFKVKFGRSYSSLDEEALRLAVFSANLEESELHERDNTKTYTVGVTQFSDITMDEFKAHHLGGGRMPGATAKSSGSSSGTFKNRHNLPTTVDWRTEGIVSNVKNQGSCGSCWAFATTEQVESYAALASGQLMELSTQQVTSCTPNPLHCGGTGGCQGSIAQLGYSYLQLFGHSLESDWPYNSGNTADTGTCSYDTTATPAAVTLQGYETLTSNDQDAVMTHLANVGPLAVNVDASHWSSYTGGVFNGCDYDLSIQINHVVQLVGYTPTAWIVRNSWGKGWGEQGYIMLARGDQCGTDSEPLMGTGCENGPGNDVQHVCGQCGVLFDTSYPIGANIA